MKVHCIKENWVLSRMGKELENISQFKDINYYIPYSQYQKTDNIDIVLFTHFDPKVPGRFDYIARNCDYAVCMSNTTAQEVRKYKDFDKIFVIQGGTDIPKKKLKFGVVGRVYPGGRKGEYLVKKLYEDGFDIVALGEGWDCPIYAKDTTNEDYTTKLREDFYSQIDYLIIPSLIEGGPIPVLDALAMGVPVIAPDTGWCWEYSTIHYAKGSYVSLKETLQKLNPPTWKDWVAEHIKLFEKISNDKSSH